MEQTFNTCTAGDPKFWPTWIRYIILANLCVFVFMGNMYASGISTGFVQLAQEFHVPFTKLADLISYSVLALGLANLFWMPTALCIGKRPAVLISMAIFVAGNIWSIKAKSFNSLLASRIVASLAAGSVEALGPSIIADLFLERYFATAMAIFSLFLAGGAQIGPMIAGFLIDSSGWRWFFILCVIINSANLVGCIFFLPETTYRRAIYAGETAAEVDKDAKEMIVHSEVAREEYAGSYWKDLFQFRNRGQETRGLAAWPKQLSLPFRFIIVPSVLYATCTYGIFLSGIVVISTLAPGLFLPPPYLFTSSDIGLYTLSGFIGIILAYPIAGPLTDLLSRVMSRRNDGIHKPEHRMPALIFPFLLAPAGLILFAYMVGDKKSYYNSAVGYSMQATGLVFVPSVVLSYVVDAYPANGGEALVLINAGKNLIAFGVTLSCNEWLANEGIKKMFCELAGAQWFLLALGGPLYFAGPSLHKATLKLIS